MKLRVISPSPSWVDSPAMGWKEISVKAERKFHCALGAMSNFVAPRRRRTLNNPRGKARMASPPHPIHDAAQTVIFKIEGDKLIFEEYLTRSSGKQCTRKERNHVAEQEKLYPISVAIGLPRQLP